MVTYQKVRPRKSIKLTADQKKYITHIANSSETKTDAGLKLGISREVLERIMLRWSCHEKTYVKLFGKEALQNALLATD
jgi:hypothetical protein